MILRRAADRADPIIGKIGKGDPFVNTPIGIAHGGIIDITAHTANISRHISVLLRLVDCPVYPGVSRLLTFCAIPIPSS